MKPDIHSASLMIFKDFIKMVLAITLALLQIIEKELKGKQRPGYMLTWNERMPHPEVSNPKEEDVKEMRYIAREFGRGVHQQKV